MTEKEVKEKILELFNEERQRPDLDFEESHFMDFLTFPPHQKNNIKNSFKGVKKYYSFMNKLELEFGICFKLSELDRYYSVNNLTKKVLERLGKRRGNIMIIKQRTGERETYYIEIFFTILIVGFYSLWEINLMTVIASFAFAFAIYWILSSKINNRLHNQKLKLKILHQEKES